MKKISICILCYNEVNNVRRMYESIRTQMAHFKQYEYEIIFSDNASTDGTSAVLRQIAQEDKQVKVIINLRNFGPDRSAYNCHLNATGDAVIALPCDFQESPEWIPSLIHYWEAGHKVVWLQKTSSRENRFKYFLRSLYYRILEKLTEHPVYYQTTGYGLLDREVENAYFACQDYHVQLRFLIPELGYPVKLIPYEQQSRKTGKSTYSLKKYYDFAIASLVSNSFLPLQLMTVFGFIIAFFSFAVGIGYFIYKLLHWDSFALGIAPLIISSFLLGGIQMFFIGLLGEYVGQILKKMTRRPIVLEAETLNIPRHESTPEAAADS